MKAFHNLGLASVLTAVILSPALAYGQAKGSGQPPAGQGPSMFQGGIQQSPWFNSPAVRQQLNMTNDQFNHLNTAHQNAWKQYQQGINGLDKNLSDDQRQQRIRDLEQNYYNSFSNSANSVFTDAQQRQRYNQLYWQYRGYGAFDDSAVANKLNLTPDQRAKLNQYRQDWSQQMNELGPLYQSDRDQAAKQFNTMQNQAGKNLNTLLTPEQQKTWQQMTGEPYTFHPEAYFQTNVPGSTGKK
jgi:hypothetical protein